MDSSWLDWRALLKVTEELLGSFAAEWKSDCGGKYCARIAKADAGSPKCLSCRYCDVDCQSWRPREDRRGVPRVGEGGWLLKIQFHICVCWFLDHRIHQVGYIDLINFRLIHFYLYVVLLSWVPWWQTATSIVSKINFHKSWMVPTHWQDDNPKACVCVIARLFLECNIRPSAELITAFFGIKKNKKNLVTICNVPTIRWKIILLVKFNYIKLLP